MKKYIVVLFAVLLFTACKKDYPIVGNWQITSASEEGEFYLENTVTYSFKADNTGSALALHEGDTIENTQLFWYLNGDTLIFGRAHRDPDYPVMPAVMLIESIDQQEMTWRHLIVGDVWIYLKRI